MAGQPEKPPTINDPVVQRLIQETGITPDQALDLVRLLGGSSWSSLLREARSLGRKR